MESKTVEGGEKSERSLLSDKALIKHIEKGTVVIDPLNESNINTSSYDVTLGNYYYRESHQNGMKYYNPYDEKHIKKIWGDPKKAVKVSEWVKDNGIELTNIDKDDYIIWIGPGETILAHTEEFIGGRDSVTTMMKARSSMGRNFIEVCKCAGWGDIGYVNRWTMEITNNSQYYSIPLVVGRRIAQIVFFDTEGTIDDNCYSKTGKYANTTDINELKKRWQPSDMLPKMYLDREI